MCTSKPPKVKPVAAPPTAPAEILDDVAMRERERFRGQSRNRYGRQATILAGGATPAVMPGKTLLGS